VPLGRPLRVGETLRQQPLPKPRSVFLLLKFCRYPGYSGYPRLRGFADDLVVEALPNEIGRTPNRPIPPALAPLRAARQIPDP
jgi:hypothetical protein